ncbi:unnamed protein product [Plutella xylostella]|uniref:(diamondback moth) hypothetical protein n=1 Tax=Plutella xylostella TaxID=51655 RepID=A0A8S4DBY2_PLUXY|nr:unnamed protein product [Plutella xylostella]
MFTFMFWSFCLCVLSDGARAHSYDQSQSGDFNVQVDLKDLHIIALIKDGKEEYVDYDYAYDYSEMTIKPQNGTTPKPLNVTNSNVNSTTVEKLNTTEAVPLDTTTAAAVLNSSYAEAEAPATVAPAPAAATVAPAPAVTTAAPAPADISTTAAPETVSLGNHTDSSIVNIVQTNSTASNASLPGCKKGFVMNQKGDCELKLPNAGNALLKLVKLSQKLKLRREKRRSTARG